MSRRQHKRRGPEHVRACPYSGHQDAGVHLHEVEPGKWLPYLYVRCPQCRRAAGEAHRLDCTQPHQMVGETAAVIITGGGRP